MSSENNNQGKEKIIIDLDQEDNYSDAGNLIQKDNFSKLKHFIYKAGQEAKKEGEKSNKTVDRVDRLLDVNRKNNVFFITGTRGSGKTFFLTSVLKEVLSKKETEKDDPSFELLARIDPTLVETGEDVFFTLTQQLNELVEKALQRVLSDESKRSLNEWRKSLQELSIGMSLLNKQRDDGESDPYLIFDEGLENARGGQELACTFAKTVDKAAQILGIDAFIIAFDDVDVSFFEGWKVQETIRRYLLHPRLIVLIAGDIRLSPHLARKHFFENFGHSFHEIDAKRNEERVGLVNHLEQQYLMKLFPTDKRITLYTIWDLLMQSLIKEPKPKYYIRYSTEEKNDFPQEIHPFIYLLIAEALYVRSDSDIRLYVTHFLKYPIRIILQVLRDVYIDKTGKGNVASARRNIPLYLSEALRNALISSLLSKRIEDAYQDLDSIIEAVYTLVVEADECETGFYLRPSPRDAILKDCFFSLAAEVANCCFNLPNRSLRYILMAPGSISLRASWERLYGKNLEEESEKRYRAYIGMGKKSTVYRWSCHASPLLCDKNITSNRKGVGTGAMIITKESQSKVFKLSEENEYDQVLSAALQIAMHNIKYSDGSWKYLSLLNIVSTISEIIGDWYLRTGETPDMRTMRVAHRLSKNMQQLTTPAPSDREATSGTEKGSGLFPSESFDEEGAELKDIPKEHEDLASLLEEEWLEKMAKFQNVTITPSAILLGKIWNRLYYGLSNIGEEYQKKEAKVSDVMELYVACLLNSSLIEESLHYYSPVGTKVSSIPLLYKNPLMTPSPLISNLNRVKNAYDEECKKVLAEGKEVESFETFFVRQFPHTAILLSSPLLSLFLSKETKREIGDGYSLFFPELEGEESSTLRKDIDEEIRIAGKEQTEPMSLVERHFQNTKNRYEDVKVALNKAEKATSSTEISSILKGKKGAKESRRAMNAHIGKLKKKADEVNTAEARRIKAGAEKLLVKADVAIKSIEKRLEELKDQENNDKES